MIWIEAAFGAASGALLGWLYFRALRLTVERLPGSRRPGTKVLLGFLLRAAAAVGALFLIARFVQVHGLIAALLGFGVVRAVMVRQAVRQRPHETDASSAS